jgi:hypothetical protein
MKMQPKLVPIQSSKQAVCLWGGIAVLTLAAPATAQTVFQTLNGAVNTAGNWDNGLPTIVSGNQGTVGINATYIGGTGATTVGQFDAWNVVQTGGTLSRAGGNATLGLKNGTTFLVNGAGAEFTYTGISLSGGSSYTMTNGTGTAATGTNARSTTIDTTSAMTFNGGTSTFNREITLTGNGTFTVNGGNITITGGATAAETGFKSSGAATTGGFFFNGGTTLAPTFDLAVARTAKFGGTTAGSLTLTSLGSNINLDWLTGSLMTMTITSSAPFWAQTEWDAGRLMFNGSNKAALSGLLWSDAINPSIGLGGGNYWNYNDSTQTLGVAFIPEPTGALAGLLLGLGLLRRRRSSTISES